MCSLCQSDLKGGRIRDHLLCEQHCKSILHKLKKEKLFEKIRTNMKIQKEDQFDIKMKKKHGGGNRFGGGVWGGYSGGQGGYGSVGVGDYGSVGTIGHGRVGTSGYGSVGAGGYGAGYGRG